MKSGKCVTFFGHIYVNQEDQSKNATSWYIPLITKLSPTMRCLSKQMLSAE